jgi:O-antigen/teichoic acid export membrane protein
VPSDTSRASDAGSSGRGSADKEGTFGENASLSAIAWLVPAVAAFFCLPVTVRGLGPDAYGLITVVSALTGYLGLLDIGLSQALLRYLSYYRALGEGRPMRAIIGRAILWFAAAGAIAGLVLFVGADWLAKDVLRVTSDLLPSAVIVIRLSALNLVLSLLVAVGATVPMSFLRYDVSAAVSGTFGTASWVGPAILVMMGYGIVAVTWFYIAANVLAILAYLYYGSRLMRGVDRDLGPEWHEIRRQVLSFAGLVGVNRIGVTLAAQTNRLVIGIVGGTAAAAFYQVPYQLTVQLTGLLTKVAQVVFPTGATLIARGELHDLRALYERSSRLLFLVNGSTAFAIAVYAEPLLWYWVSPAYAEQSSTALVVFVAAASLNAASLTVGFLSWSAAKAGVNLAFSLLSSGVSLAAIYPLASRYGVTGAAVAGLLGALIAPVFIYYVERRILDVSSWSVFRHCYLPTLAGAGLAALLSAVFLVRLAHGLPVTIALSVLTMVLASVFSALFGAVKRDELRGTVVAVKNAWNNWMLRR